MRGSRPFGVQIILDFIRSILDFIFVFFKTLFDPSAADDFSRRQSNRRGGGGGPPKPPPGGGGGYGRRIAGLSDLRDASGSCAAGGGA